MNFSPSASRLGLMALALLGTTAWKSVGSMADTRAEHSTTTLLDGRVLVAGGYDNQAWEDTVYRSSTELFDPTDGLWHSGPALIESRSGHASVLLADGRVLVMGGFSADTWAPNIILHRDSVEIFNPTMNVWTFAAPMSILRGEHIEAVLLADGRVLAIQGNAAEIFDPMSNTWTVTETPAEYRCGFQATPLLDGRVLFTGGNSEGCWYSAGTALASAATYDPATGHFVNVGPMASARIDHVAVRLVDGRVLIAGGHDNQYEMLNSAEIFDPTTNTFAPAAPMLFGRYDAPALVLPSGEVLVAGGVQHGSPQKRIIDDVERFDPISGTWHEWFPMKYERVLHSLALLPNGEVLVAGGFYDSETLSDAFFCYSQAETSGDLSIPFSGYNGGPCTNSQECASEQCMDGVCCETYCPGDGCHDCSGMYGPKGQCVALTGGVPCLYGPSEDQCNTWACESGTCTKIAPVICDQPPDPSCTQSISCIPQLGCQYAPSADGTACVVNGSNGACVAGICEIPQGTSSSSSSGNAGAGGSGGAGMGGSAGAGEGGNAGAGEGGSENGGEGGSAGAGGMIGSSSSSATGSSSGKPSGAHQESARNQASCSVTSRTDEFPRGFSFFAGLGFAGLLAARRRRRISKTN